MSDRRVPPGGGIVIGLVLGILMWVGIVALARAQEPTSRDTTRQWLVVVDTAGIAPIAPNVYATWVYALSSPTSFPSSGILVAWNCEAKLVRRFAQVKYEWNADSTGVQGPIVEVNRPWQAVSDMRMYNLVCSIGPTHVYDDKDDRPRVVPVPDKAWDGKSFDA
jgi:hypothetical protein